VYFLLHKISAVLAVLFITQLVAPHTLHCQERAHELIQASEAKVQRLNALQFNVDFRNKPYVADDTVHYWGTVSYTKNETGWVFIRSVFRDFYETRLTRDVCRIINHQDRTIQETSPEQKPLWVYKGQITEQLVPAAFVAVEKRNPKRPVFDDFFYLERIISRKPGLKGSLTDTDSLWKIKLAWDNNYFELWIGKSDTLPRFVEILSHPEGLVEFSSMHFSNYSYTADVSDMESGMDSISDAYEISMYQYKRSPPLDIGTLVSWSGTTLEGAPLSHSTFLGKYVLLDFWYKECAPCIKAIPFVNNLQKIFPRLVVLGLNHRNKDKNTLRKHIEHFKMEYLPVLVANELPKQLKVSSYPSYLLIGPDGKLLWQKTGYSKESEKEIRDAIRENTGM
jgi:thiol-disulfide isomerase/thioredoxin